MQHPTQVNIKGVSFMQDTTSTNGDVWAIRRMTVAPRTKAAAAMMVVGKK